MILKKIIKKIINKNRYFNNLINQINLNYQKTTDYNSGYLNQQKFKEYEKSQK